MRYSPIFSMSDSINTIQVFSKKKRLAWLCLAAFAIAHLSFETSTAQAFVLDKKSWNCNGLTFTKTRFNWKGEDSSAIEVRRRGKLLLRRQAHDVWLWTIKNGEFTEMETKDSFKTEDLNGDGIKDFVIRQWSGGAYCCYTYEVFSTGADCPRLWHNEAGCAHLKIIRGQLKPAILAMEDGSFLQWRTHIVSETRPIVYLTWKSASVSSRLTTRSSLKGITASNAAPILDRKRMLRPIDASRFSKLKDSALNNDKEQFFIELVYTGHSDAALKLLANIEVEERKEFVKSFVTALKRGPFYYKIVALNGPKFTDLTRLRFA